MARDDWYRNTTWNEAIETDYQSRLRRARDKSRYLRIQASYLADRHPKVALRLLDQYFALGEHFDIAQAFVDKARALKAEDDLEGALQAYEAAIEREKSHPNLITQAYLDFACLIADTNFDSLYYRALEVLDTHRTRPMFPVDRYRASGARALLLHSLGLEEEARSDATLAMTAASEIESGFRYHQQLGLVKDVDDDFGRRVAILARQAAQ